MDLTKYEATNWKNDFIYSLVPDICKEEPCVLGVDEAGRGPVLGPMVYGVCYCPVSRENDLRLLGAVDSKTLTEEKREAIFTLIHENNDYIGWALECIAPMYISNCMYKRNKISLNEISQTSAGSLIQKVLDAGVNLTSVFVDTVGDPQKYQDKLQQIFPSLTITVSKKADSLFPVVSAASICAKVARDRIVKKWIFPEGIEFESWGSGYPGDSVTKNFLMNSLDIVFGFPALVRFSWSTAEKIIAEKCVSVKYLGDEEEKCVSKIPSVLQYFSQKRKMAEDDSSPQEYLPNQMKRHFYFTDRFLERLETL